MSTPDRIREFMADYNVSRDEVWQVPGGKSWAVKHSALERIAAEKGITFDLPQIIEGSTNDKVVTILVVGRMGDTEVWSFGEASAANCKNAYVWSMAEKRGKDRCVLKLLAVHGAVYSEDEADEFKQTGETQSSTMQMLRASVDALDGENAVKPIVTTGKGFDKPPGKGQPAGWNDLVSLVNAATNYAELIDAMQKPFFKNTVSGYSNWWTRRLVSKFVAPRVAEFRGADEAIEWEKRILARYPLDPHDKPVEAAE